MKERKCTKCSASKPLNKENFFADPRYREGFKRQCRSCVEKYNSAYQTQDRKERPKYYRDREFLREMKKYGTTIDWYRDKLISQNGLCAICDHLSRRYEKLERLQVDHDHACCDLKTKSCGSCLRGLLCADCNVRLSYLEGFLRESQVTAQPNTWTARAISYLESYEPKPWNFTEQAQAWLSLALATPGNGIRLTNVQVPSVL